VAWNHDFIVLELDPQFWGDILHGACNILCAVMIHFDGKSKVNDLVFSSIAAREQDIVRLDVTVQITLSLHLDEEWHHRTHEFTHLLQRKIVIPTTTLPNYLG